ncbi:hypothetical protein WMF11_23325 [Sorangium sp. So ce295]|uniref:hypothetical protein n=1 Tax=Sorangium sp. So ce295 TaxID=3133295 RepID=UPI003F5E4434
MGSFHEPRSGGNVGLVLLPGAGGADPLGAPLLFRRVLVRRQEAVAEERVRLVLVVVVLGVAWTRSVP